MVGIFSRCLVFIGVIILHFQVECHAQSKALENQKVFRIFLEKLVTSGKAEGESCNVDLESAAEGAEGVEFVWSMTPEQIVESSESTGYSAYKNIINEMALGTEQLGSTQHVCDLWKELVCVEEKCKACEGLAGLGDEEMEYAKTVCLFAKKVVNRKEDGLPTSTDSYTPSPPTKNPDGIIKTSSGGHPHTNHPAVRNGKDDLTHPTPSYTDKGFKSTSATYSTPSYSDGGLKGTSSSTSGTHPPSHNSHRGSGSNKGAENVRVIIASLLIASYVWS